MKKLLSLVLALVITVLAAVSCAVPDGDKSNSQTGQTEEYISLQAEALVTVAKAYYDRSIWYQYDNNYKEGGTQLYRIQYRENSPEDISSQYTAYTNCSHFVYDVYYEALGVDLGHLTTKALAEEATDMQVFAYTVTGRESEEQKRLTEQKFADTVRQGDIVVCRHKGEGGHAFLYIGNGQMLESVTFGALGGGDYDYSNNRDRIEVAGTVYYREFMSLLRQDSYNYFWKEKSWFILRPLDKYGDIEPTPNTLNRIKNLKNIRVEKISSHPTGKTADIGEEITYTYNIRNNRSSDAQLEITDRIPEHTEYVSGGSLSGDSLSWSVNVPAGESVSVSYTVRVDADPALYDDCYIESKDGVVGGVKVGCRRVFVGRHLTDTQQQALRDAAVDMTVYTARGMELANEIYKNAGIDVELASLEEIFTQVFADSKTAGCFKLQKEGTYPAMIVPTLYGGKLVTNSSRFGRERTRGAKEYQLYVGDIMVGSERGANSAYMYIGDNRLLDLQMGRVLSNAALDDALVSGWGMERYVFLRPAAVYNDIDPTPPLE